MVIGLTKIINAHITHLCFYGAVEHGARITSEVGIPFGLTPLTFIIAECWTSPSLCLTSVVQIYRP